MAYCVTKTSTINKKAHIRVRVINIVRYLTCERRGATDDLFQSRRRRDATTFRCLTVSHVGFFFFKLFSRVAPTREFGFLPLDDHATDRPPDRRRETSGAREFRPDVHRCGDARTVFINAVTVVRDGRVSSFRRRRDSAAAGDHRRHAGTSPSSFAPVKTVGNTSPNAPYTNV